jgi:hypothetical protein
MTFNGATENKCCASRYAADRINIPGSMSEDLMSSDLFQTVPKDQIGEIRFLFISREVSIRSFLISEEHCIKAACCSENEVEFSYLSHTVSQIPLFLSLSLFIYIYCIIY